MGVQRRMLYTQFRIVISAPFARADLPSDCTCPWNQMAVLAPRPALASDGDNREPSINLNVTTIPIKSFLGYGIIMYQLSTIDYRNPHNLVRAWAGIACVGAPGVYLGA